MALTLAKIVARDREVGAPVIPTMPPNQRQIVNEVAAKHGLQPHDLFRRTLARVVVAARHETWTRILDETPTNMHRVAARWDWDAVAVRRGIERHRSRAGVSKSGVRLVTV